MNKESDKKAEALVNAAPPTNGAIKLALEVHKKEQEEAQSKRIIKQLGEIDTVVNNGVEALRAVRRMEAAAKASLVKLVEAKDQYMIDADYDKFSAVANSIDTFVVRG